jgi:hypothetical protein
VGEQVPEAERGIRTVAGHPDCRGTPISTISLSPRAIVTGIQADFNTHCPVPIGPRNPLPLLSSSVCTPLLTAKSMPKNHALLVDNPFVFEWATNRPIIDITQPADQPAPPVEGAMNNEDEQENDVNNDDGPQNDDGDEESKIENNQQEEEVL